MYIKGKPLTGKIESSESGGEASVGRGAPNPPKPLSEEMIKRIREELAKANCYNEARRPSPLAPRSE